MPIDLAAALPVLMPRAAAWAEQVSAGALRDGRALDSDGLALARAAGVRRPECVRVCVVAAIPAPEDAELRAAAQQAGLLGPDTAGLTLGHAVFIRRGFEHDRTLLRHELRHVHQFECYGSIKAFLAVYLPQIVQFGYQQAPLEIDARTHANADGAGAASTASPCRDGADE